MAQEAIPLKEFGRGSLIMVSRKSPVSSTPVWFEETDSLIYTESKKDTVLVEFYSRYSNRKNIEGVGKRKTIFKNGEVKVEVNDTLVTHFNRKKDEFDGIIGGKKGLIVKRLLPSSSTLLPSTEQYILKEDSTNFLIYRPETALIELEISSLFQRNRMLGSLFRGICSSQSGNKDYEPFNRNLTVGDTLQILYKQRKLNAEKQSFEFFESQLLTLSINSIEPADYLTEIEFSSFMTDLSSSTRYNSYTGKLQFYDEALALDNYIYIKDELFEKNFQILPSSSPLRPHPYYPLIDLVGAQIEASWDEKIAVGDTSVLKTCYWNSVNNSRLNYLPIFPLAWRDDGDAFIGNPNYIKLNNLKKGEPYRISENHELHFSKIEQTRDSIYIYINSPKKVNIALDFRIYDKEKVIKKSYGMSKGEHLIAIPKAAFRVDYSGDLILYELDGQKKIMKQSFRYTEQKNL